MQKKKKSVQHDIRKITHNNVRQEALCVSKTDFWTVLHAQMVSDSMCEARETFCIWRDEKAPAETRAK